MWEGIVSIPLVVEHATRSQTCDMRSIRWKNWVRLFSGDALELAMPIMGTPKLSEKKKTKWISLVWYNLDFVITVRNRQKLLLVHHGLMLYTYVYFSYLYRYIVMHKSCIHIWLSYLILSLTFWHENIMNTQRNSTTTTPLKYINQYSRRSFVHYRTYNPSIYLLCILLFIHLSPSG